MNNTAAVNIITIIMNSIPIRKKKNNSSHTLQIKILNKYVYETPIDKR